ncbi:MAG TPA: alpha/beta hydrolase-fold protein [Ktedonobacterales bacterium]
MRQTPMPDSLETPTAALAPTLAEAAPSATPAPAPAGARERARRALPPWLAGRWLALARWLAALAVVALAAPVISAAGLVRQVNDEMLALSFDGERAHLIALLCLTLCCAAVAGLVWLRRTPAWLGATALFVVVYIWPFYQQALRPGLGIGGRPQVLVPGALTAAALSLLATGSLVAAIGAVLGEALGRLITPPLVALGWPLVARLRHRPGAAADTHGAARLSPARAALSLVALALVALSLVFGGQGLGAFLMYGVSTQLYQPPVLARQAGPRDLGIVREDAYRSAALGGRQRDIRVYLPPSYGLDAQRRFPVLYLLHGAPGTYRDWFIAGHAAATEDALLAAHLIHETIIVAADGNGPVYKVSAWANSFDGRQRMEDAIATDLVRYVDATYRTRADAGDRFIAGLSEGGYGAVNIALHHPDVFGAAVSLSGFFRADRNVVFGGGPASVAYRVANSPADYLQTAAGQGAARRLRFILGVGTSDGVYYTGTTAFARQLTLLGVDVRYMQAPGGHSWKLWGQQLGEALRQLASLSDQAPAAGRA